MTPKDRICTLQTKLRPWYPKAMQASCVDGFWGPASIRACRAYVRSLMPATSPWPAPNAAALRKFYGAPGQESMLTRIVFPFPMTYEGRPVTSTRAHMKCAASLLRVLTDIVTRHGKNDGVMEVASRYSGCYENRLKTNGSTPSTHAHGAGFDLDAEHNSFVESWPMKATMPLEIIECFAREGWVSAAVFWGYDAMHEQATQLT